MAKQQKPGGDSFATFLESLQRRMAAQQKVSGDAFSKLLATLGETGSQAVPDLMAASGMGVLEFTEALKAMGDAGLITLSGAPGQERVELTKSGEQIARVARAQG